ncbi:MAG TPA: SH3 domain-containing protein [Spirochaetota bacterium]|nr:SH3 domain-containing protein [Spirochaetota bacterium]
MKNKKKKIYGTADTQRFKVVEVYMKNVISLLLLSCMFLLIITCSKREHIDNLSNYQYVISENGIILRESPSIESKSLKVIPFKTKLLIKESIESLTIVNNIAGKWYKVEWNGIVGYVFSGYLRPKDDNDTTFYFFNHIPFDEKNIIESSAFDSNTTWGTTKNIKLNEFKLLPSIIPGSEIIVMDLHNVYKDKITSLNLTFNQIGTFLNFKVESKYSNKALIADLSSYFKHYKKIPKPYKMIIESNSNIESFIRNNYDKRDIVFTMERDISIDDYTAGIIQNFEITTFRLLKNMTLVTFKNKKSDEWYYNALIVTSNDKVIYSINGNCIYSYDIDGVLYILVEEWTPHSGYGGSRFLKIDPDKIETVASDFSYSD